MRKEASLTKISPPKITGVLQRKRLFKLLDEKRAKPVVYISGPPGSGKTTLLASYLTDRKLPCIWYQIDEGDGDIASFFYYMGIAAKKAAPRFRKPLPNLTPEYLLGLPTFTRSYFRELYSRINPNEAVKRKTAGGRFIIVLDNYQDAPADSPLHEIIQAGLSEMPEGISVIIISRTEPPAAFAGLRANNKMDSFGWNDLSLTIDETYGIARLKGVKDPSEELVQQLHDRVNGWTAGIVLMLERQKTEDLLQKNGGTFTPQVMFDYFAGVIFQKLDAASQEILLKTAFLPIISARFAQQLTGSHKAGEILSDLNNRNYFTIRKSLPDPVYQYHPLFREFLLAQARHRLAPAQLVKTQRKAAEILEEAGQLEDAIILYSQAGDWPSMLRIIFAAARSVIMEGRSQTLEAWLRAVPEKLHNEQPWLLYWLGACRMPFNLPEGRGYFEQAFERFKLQNNPAGIFLAWAGVVETYIYQWGDFKPLDKWIAEVEALLVKYPELPSPEIQAKVTAGVFTALMYRQPQHPALPVWTERLHRLIEVSPDPSLSMIMGNHLLLYYTWWSGDLAKGTNLVNMLEPLSRTPDLAPLSRIAWYAIKAAHCWMAGDNSCCLQAVEDGLKIADESGVHVWDFMLLAQGVWGMLTSGEIDKVPLMFKKMLSVMDKRRLLDACHYQFQAFIEAMHRDDAGQMMEHAEAALRLAREAGVIWAEGVMLLSAARAYAACGRKDDAAEAIKQAMQIAQDIRSKTIESGVLHARMEFAMKQGNKDACLHALQKTFTFDRQHGIVNISSWRFSVMSQACAIALEHNIEADYVKALIKRRCITPPEEMRCLENWPWPIRIYTLGRFSLLIDDKPIQFTNRGQKKPMELLKALIALGGRDVPQAEVIDLLWPDAEGDASYRSLITCLQRLRGIIKYKDAVIHTESRLTLDTRYIWADNWAFERLINNAEDIENEGNHEKACEIRIKALAYYNGSFLGKDDEQGRLVSTRERLRVKFIRQVELTGKYWEGIGDWGKALECYQKALGIDNLSEVFYQRLMRIYQRLGRNSDAVLAYQRCCKELSSRIGIPPSHTTVEIYNSIQKR